MTHYFFLQITNLFLLAFVQKPEFRHTIVYHCLRSSKYLIVCSYSHNDISSNLPLSYRCIAV